MAKRTYEVPIPQGVEPEAGLAEAREKARGVGITLTGDSESGSFSGAAQGSYERLGSALRFRIDKKPMIVSWGMIEKGLQKVFGDVTVVD